MEAEIGRPRPSVFLRQRRSGASSRAAFVAGSEISAVVSRFWAAPGCGSATPKRSVADQEFIKGPQRGKTGGEWANGRGSCGEETAETPGSRRAAVYPRRAPGRALLVPGHELAQGMAIIALGVDGGTAIRRQVDEEFLNLRVWSFGRLAENPWEEIRAS